MMPKVRSVCENTTTGMVLVGTRGGEIVEFGGPKPLVHIRGHFEGELWGLATHPQRAEFITVGQDNVLAIWDIATRKQKRFGKLEQSGNVAALSSNGQLLAIGYINGAVHVLQPDNKFAMKANKKDRVKAISDIKFNPNDTLMAVAAHDSLIILYDVVQNFKPLRKMRGHSSTVAHMDFSLDGKTIMSNCTSYNILFFDTTSGKHMPSGASMFKDETWASWTCTLGWPVQGIFPPFADGSDINACDRSPDSTIIATADDFGTVKLFKYPSPVEKASYNQYIGHSSHVTNARFVKSSPYLITTGGEDKCIFQWKYLIDKESQRQSAQMASAAAVQDLSNIANDIYTPPPPKSVAA
jgi:microtubule-associated protein-like 6